MSDFKKVMCRDKITVAGDGREITGQVTMIGGSVRGARFLNLGPLRVEHPTPGGRWEVGGLPVALVAHEPAEPDWHRAKVIEADYRDGGADRYFICAGSGQFIGPDGLLHRPEALTNVVIIVDEHGNVVAPNA